MRYILGLLISLIAVNSVAELSDPEVRINQNKQTDLFERSTGNAKQVQDEYLQLKEQAKQGIQNKQGLGLITSETEASLQQKTQQLQGATATQLEAQGMQEVLEQNIMEQFYVDYERPLNKQAMEDAKVLANAQKKLLQNLQGKLKELDVECKVEKGEKEQEPVYFLQLEQKPIKNTIYNQTFCEELRNRYTCTDRVHLKCLQFAEKQSGFEILNSTIPFRHTASGNLSSYDFSNRGDIAHSSYSGGGKLTKGFGHKLLGALGLGINKGSTTQLSPSTTSVEVSFRINIPVNTVSKVELVAANYSALMLVRLNQKLVGVFPVGGNQLALAGFHSVVVKGERKYGGLVGRRTKHETLYPIVDTGYGKYILGLAPNNNATARIDLRPHLVEGINHLAITVIGLNQALISFKLHALERVCLQWQEQWEERCFLK